MMPAMKSVAEPGVIAATPDLLPGGSADTGEAGAKSGQSGQYPQPLTLPPSCRSFLSTESRAQTFVPVSMAARDWKVTPRRIRFLLGSGRLEGLQGANGYWMVPPYPYRFTFGARGAGLKRFQGQVQTPRGAV